MYKKQPLKVAISLLIVALSVKTAECNIACIYQGFDSGNYIEKSNECACVTLKDYALICKKIMPTRNAVIDPGPVVYQTW